MKSAGPTEALEQAVTLRNGAAIRLRRIRPDDESGLISFFGRLSTRSVYQRFFTVRRLRHEEAAALSSVDGYDRMAIVAEQETGQRTELVGVAQYGLAGDELTPDVALVVEDAWQGLGLGPILLTEILRAGEGQGFSMFRADILAENARMLRLLARYADVLQRTADHGVIRVLFRRLTDPRDSSKPAHSWSSDIADAAMAIAYASTPAEGETFATTGLKINVLEPVWTAILRAPDDASSVATVSGSLSVTSRTNNRAWSRGPRRPA